MACVLAFDLAPGSSGYCVGDGQGVPTAGAWRFPPLGDDLGALAAHMQDQAGALIREHQPDLVAYEAPILVTKGRHGGRSDTLADLRRIYGLGVVLELTCVRFGVRVAEVDLRRVKKVMTGDHQATKSQVVRAAMGLGIPLPTTKDEGREDAADAVGVWMIGLSEVDGSAAAPWLARLGGLLL
jgi:Holliday junction resolvasome RuvABC endonuclease subunit